MGTTVDSLDIQLQMQSQRAVTSIDTLISRLGTLNASLTKINGSGLTGVANGVNKLSNAMQGLKSVGAVDYSRLAKGIEKISSLDNKQISSAATALKGLGKGLESLNSASVSGTSKQIAELAGGIAKLGYTSSTKAIENIPKLAHAMQDLMSSLSKAPRVSQNLIDMTNALAKLARTGASSGKAATSLSRSLDAYTKSTGKASSGTKGLASALGKMYASYWLLFQAFQKIGQSITLASDLVEVQNVVNTVFGDMTAKVEQYADRSIEQFGMSELAFKQYASRFQAMGSAMGIDSGIIGQANSFLNKATNGYVGLSDSMADVSLNLTQLTADMSSFYNVSQEDVAQNLQAIFTGETEPLRKYGLDLTQATLAEWAMKQGLDANIQSMSQAEKTMLRYQYVLANTTAAQGDFARTANTWANQVRILQEQIKKWASVVGTGFIAAFKPFLQTLNTVMARVIDFTENVLNALGNIFGWKFEISGGGITDDLADSMGDTAIDTGDAAGSAGDLSDNLGDAASNAKKLYSTVLGIDELNINNPNTGSSGSGSGGSGGTGGSGSGGAGAGTGTGLTTTMTRNDAILEAYESSIDSLYELGEYIGNTLTKTLNSINWDRVYQGARNFGKGLADFLNGLISPELFGSVGRTIAGALNTAIYAALSFGETFDFYDFGVSIATGINEFFRTFDFGALAQTLNVWVDGLIDTIAGFLKTISWSDILKGIGNFLGNLELDTITVIIGAIAWKLGAVALIKKGLLALISKGIGKLVLSLTGVELGKITFTGVAKAFGGALKSALGQAGTSIISAISGAFGVSGAAATGIFAGIIAAVVAIGVAIKDLWDTSESFRNTVKGVWDNICETFANAKTRIWDNTLKPLWERIKEFGNSLGELWNAIYSGYESSGLKILFEQVISYSIQQISTAISMAVGAISSAIEAIGGIISGIIESLTGVIDFLTGVFTGNWEKAWQGVIGVIKGFGNTMSSLWKGIWNIITSIFSPIVDFFKETFSRGYNQIKNAFQSIGTWFHARWDDVKRIFVSVPATFKSWFINAYTNVKNAFQSIGTWFHARWDDVKNVFKNVASFFKDGFQKAYDAVKNIWDGLGGFFKGIAENAFKPIKSLVNGVISGINWVLDKVGSKKTLSKWGGIKFAKGSNGLPQDTLGVVNDQPGSTYKELIVPPSGKPFIPEGRNVMLPLEKGTKIMPAKQTKAFMSGISGTPHFAGGIGDFFGNAWNAIKSFTGDVMDYLTRPGDMVKIAIDKFVGISDFVDPWLSIAGGMVNKAISAITDFIKGIFDDVGGKGVEGAIRWALKIAADNSHGYDQASRWGPNYDCSSLVIQAFEQAGIKLKSHGATYTGNMYSAAKKAGFNDITSSVNLGNASGMKRGDILLNKASHAALYLGNGRIVQASVNELGKTTGGKTGDQTGREILERSYYNYPWDAILRFAGKYKNGIGKINMSDLIPAYEVGGFPEDGLFFANHNELVGQFDNGRTVVANNTNIQSGIKEGVKEAVSEILAPYLQQIADNTRETADKDFTVDVDGRSLVSAYDRRKSRNGFSFT